MYAVEKGLMNEKGLEWTKDFIKDTESYERLIFALKTSKSFGPKYKFGIEVPRLVKHALELDAKNGNTLWRDAIMTELKQLDDSQVFRTIDPDEMQYVPRKEKEKTKLKPNKACVLLPAQDLIAQSLVSSSK